MVVYIIWFLETASSEGRQGSCQQTTKVLLATPHSRTSQ